MNTITDKTYKALSILSSASWDRPMSAKEFTEDEVREFVLSKLPTLRGEDFKVAF